MYISLHISYTDYPTIMWTLPAVLYSASLLGLDKKKEAWMRSSADGRTELAFDYFYVPCSDGTFAKKGNHIEDLYD